MGPWLFVPRGPADGDGDHTGGVLKLGNLNRVDQPQRRLDPEGRSEGYLESAGPEYPGPFEAGEVLRADLRSRRSTTTDRMGRGRSHCRKSQGLRPVKGRYIPFARGGRGAEPTSCCVSVSSDGSFRELCVERDRQRKPAQGREAAEMVYRKCAEFDSGVGSDAGRPVDEVVSDIAPRLRPA